MKILEYYVLGRGRSRGTRARAGMEPKLERKVELEQQLINFGSSSLQSCICWLTSELRNFFFK